MSDYLGPYAAFQNKGAPVFFDEFLTCGMQLWGLWLEGAVQVGRFQSDLARAAWDGWAASAGANLFSRSGSEEEMAAVADEIVRAAAAISCPPTPLPE